MKSHLYLGTVLCAILVSLCAVIGTLSVVKMTVDHRIKQSECFDTGVSVIECNNLGGKNEQ